ncbi:hypothetical protein PG995_004497 [Apiospora arundinis]
MCTAENITTNTADKAYALPTMTWPQTNDQAYRLEADQNSSCFDFPYLGLSLGLERLDGGSTRSTLSPWTEDQAADFPFDRAVSPKTLLPSECLNGSNLGIAILDDMLYFLGKNPAECGDKWCEAWEELVKGGVEHDGTSNDDTVQARSLSPASPSIPSLDGADLVKGYLPAQNDPEDSVSVEASLPGYDDCKLPGTAVCLGPRINEAVTEANSGEDTLGDELFHSFELPQVPGASNTELETSLEGVFAANDAQTLVSTNKNPTTASPGPPTLDSPVPSGLEKPTDASFLVPVGDCVTVTQGSPTAETSPTSPTNYTNHWVDSAAPLDTDEERQLNPLSEMPRRPCLKRKATLPRSEEPPKRQKQRGLNLRLEQVTVHAEGSVKDLTWNRRRGVWIDKSKSFERKGEPLKCHVLGNLSCSSLRLRPNGDWLPIDVSWDDTAGGFIGSSPTNKKRVSLGKEELSALFNDPNVGVVFNNQGSR